MGLRERQKADRLRRILDAAAARFREMGFDAARIEDIAEAAEVSVGTVYNYFDGKGDVLVAIVSREVEAILDQGEALMAQAEARGEGSSAVGRLVAMYLDHSLLDLSKEMWRTAMAMAIQHPTMAASRRYASLDESLRDQVRAALARLVRRGAIDAGRDTEALGAVIFNDVNALFTDFVRDEDQTLDEVQARVARHLAAVLG